MRLALSTISTAAIITAIFISSGDAAKAQQRPDFSKLTEDFVYGSLEWCPASATQAGYHEQRGVRLDERLDDFSPAGIAEARKFYEGFDKRLAAIDPRQLSAGGAADYQFLRKRVS